MNINFPKVAIVHDWFLKKSLSGSEKVTLLIDECMTKNYSEPDIFSLTSNLGKLEYQLFNGRKIKTSFIQNLPFGKTNVQKYLPLLPFAIEQIDLSKYDLILARAIHLKELLQIQISILVMFIHLCVMGPNAYIFKSIQIFKMWISDLLDNYTN